MSKFNDIEFRKQFSKIFIKLAERVEQDEQFTQWLFEGIDFSAKKNSKEKNSKSEIQSVALEVSQLPDIFTIFSFEGAEGLRDQLNTYEVEVLKEVVLKNGLDPVRKVRRWKTKNKIITYIVDVISKQMSKGNSFLDER